jgi:hypothetical protein
MGLTFTKKKTEATAQAEVGAAPAETKTVDTTATKYAATDKPKPSGGVTFLKKGEEAKKAVAQEDARAEERRAANERMRRFFLGNEKEGQITFLDGKLDDKGILDVPRFFEHFIRIGNKPETFVCTAEIDQTVPCPICEAGDKASLVGVLTVIDHTPYTVTKGPSAGKTFKNRRKLFVAKEGTLKILNTLAKKPERNGLAGCTFDVSRGPKSKNPPAVGDTFDFVAKHKSFAAIAEKFGIPIEEVQPAIYDGEEGEIPYLTPAKLIELGVGKATIGIGAEKGVTSASDEL